MENLVEKLNHNDLEVRLDALRSLKGKIDGGEIEKPVQGNDVNNHIHTFYSFSPYSPTKAIWMAYMAGLTTAGIMDHDSISGVREFIEAGRIIGMETTIGVECRADMSTTPLKGRRLNNPDQDSIAYVTIHGIPHTQIDRVEEFFKPFIAERNIRNRKMAKNLDTILGKYGMSLDFDRDIVPLSKSHEGGSVTERHILFAVNKKIIERFGKGAQLVRFLKENLKIAVSTKVEALLLDEDNSFYEYDLLGALKSEMVPLFYINATAECPDIRDVVNLAKEVSGILAYAYLGDVGDSVTGDKKTQKFEDDYLELVFGTLNSLGIRAITYMPSRNTVEQLERVKELCKEFGFFQISGEDINSPRQSFVCEKQRLPMFKSLVEATWALIGHEKAATKDLEDGFFSEKTVAMYPDLEARIAEFARR